MPLSCQVPRCITGITVIFADGLLAQRQPQHLTHSLKAEVIFPSLPTASAGSPTCHLVLMASPRLIAQAVFSAGAFCRSAPLRSALIAAVSSSPDSLPTSAIWRRFSGVASVFPNSSFFNIRAFLLTNNPLSH